LGEVDIAPVSNFVHVFNFTVIGKNRVGWCFRKREWVEEATRGRKRGGAGGGVYLAGASAGALRGQIKLQEQ